MSVRGRAPLFIQGIQLVLLNLARITDDGGEIHAVRIPADVSLLHRHALQIRDVLIDFHHGFLTDIGGHCGFHILLIAGQIHGVNNIDHIQSRSVRKDQRIALLVLHLIQLVLFLLIFKCLIRCDIAGVASPGVVQLVRAGKAVKIQKESGLGRV